MARMGGVALIALAVSGTAWGGDWPQWFGPGRDGRALDEPGFAAGWADGVRELWRVPIGAGYASVAVADGVVAAMTTQGEEEQLLLLDAATGAERWRARVGPAYIDGMSYHGPRATPSLVGDVVVALGGHGGLIVVDRATGARRWAVDVAKTHGGVAPQWGFSGSPLVHDGRVYLTTGNESGEGLLAVSLADGTKVWSTGSFPAGYSSPIHATLGGVPQIVFFTGEAAVGARPSDGSTLWSHPWPTNYDVNAATPLVLGSNRLFIASGYGVGGALLLVTDAQEVSELWRTKKMKNKTSTSVLRDGVLYGFNEEALTALDATTGEPHWTEKAYGRGTLVLADDHLVVLDDQCTLHLLEATPEGHRVVGGSFAVGKASPCWTAPAVAQGVVYARDGADLVAVEVRAMGPTPAPPPAVEPAAP
ncbi:MAG: PQQ-like beta-propeller repeat protein [Alphaproteobacteria bacterium]|nr:PQQ-like beta-propeller repeat protein [Alphaproteobacteria bacterium]